MNSMLIWRKLLIVGVAWWSFLVRSVFENLVAIVRFTVPERAFCV